MPARVLGDPGRLRQVLINLIGNAIKFTDRGEVVSRDRAFAGRPDALHFSVRDTGIGIPAEKQAMIFEAFTQVDGSFTRRFGGTGLGLTIASRLVQMMEGRIWVESQEGRGQHVPFHRPAGAGFPERWLTASMYLGLPDCKPVSVPSWVGRKERQSFLWARHYCQALATYPEVERSGPLLLPYLVLLRMGFALPDGSLHPRCALTAPFHPYRKPSLRPISGGIFSVALSVKSALSEPPRPLAGMLPYGDRTFLPRNE